MTLAQTAFSRWLGRRSARLTLTQVPSSTHGFPQLVSVQVYFPEDDHYEQVCSHTGRVPLLPERPPLVAAHVRWTDGRQATTVDETLADAYGAALIQSGQTFPLPAMADTDMLNIVLSSLGLSWSKGRTGGFAVQRVNWGLHVGTQHLADLDVAEDVGRLNLTTLATLFPELVAPDPQVVLKQLGLTVCGSTLSRGDGRVVQCVWQTCRSTPRLNVYDDDEGYVLLAGGQRGWLLEFEGLAWLQMK